VEEKMELVEEHRGAYGLNQSLRALGLSKGTYYYRRNTQRAAERQGRDMALKERIIPVIQDNPSYGYRRIHAELCANGADPVNHKRIRRVLGDYELGLRRCLPKSRPSAAARLITQAGASADLVKDRRFEPLGAFSTDFTEFIYDGGKKKAWLMVLLDIESKWAGGWSVGPSRNRSMALEAVDGLREEMISLGRGDLSGVIVHHDKDSVYTSHAWLHRLLLEERARLSYAERGARDNPWIESFWGRFETENGELILEAESIEEVRKIVNEQLDYYNHGRRHSALDYRVPYEVVSETIAGEDGRR
jgi:transposase InsO family protein